jgi:hypothetical protein
VEQASCLVLIWKEQQKIFLADDPAAGAEIENKRGQVGGGAGVDKTKVHLLEANP